METRDLLRKLEPIIPRRVAQWKRSLEYSDAETTRLIKLQIRNAAKRVFGQNVDDQVILSLPPRTTAKGSIRLGTVMYEKEKWPFGLSTTELMQNLAIFGRSGAGKTNVVFEILLQFKKRRIPFLFLDWKKTARHMLPYLAGSANVYLPGSDFAPLPFNPLIPPPGRNRSSYILQVVDLLANAFTLGDGAKSVLQNAIQQCFKNTKHPTLADVKTEITRLKTINRQTGWKLSATRAIESLTFGDTDVDAKSQIAFARSLLTQNTLVELDGLSANVKKFLIPLLCSWIYAVRLQDVSREKLKYVIVFEEAHHVLYRQEHRNHETLMNQLLRQGRELGIGSIVVDQQPHLISSAALANCYASICLNLKDPSDMNKAAGLSLVPDSMKYCFSRLPVGTGIVKLQDRWHEPFVIRFPLVPLMKGSVSDALIRQYVNGELTLSKLRERCDFLACPAANDREREIAFSDDDQHSRSAAATQQDAYRLLEDVLSHPDDGVDVRYERLGISRDRGNQWKNSLVSQGLLSQEKSKVGRTYRVLLRPTDFARSVLASKNGNDPQASFTHEYWKRKIAAKLKRDGYKVALESPRQKSSGNIDIRASKQNRVIAVEIETGKSNVISNVKRDLFEGVNEVWVVVTTAEALRNVEKVLAKAGLILPKRIQLATVDDALFSVVGEI